MFSDVSGYVVYDLKIESFKICCGLVFINLLLVDEINCVLVKI